MNVCQKHMIEGLRALRVPHVKRLKYGYVNKCNFCPEAATFKLFYGLPFVKNTV